MTALSRPDPSASLQHWLDWISVSHPQEIDLGLKRVAEVARRLDVLVPAPYVITVAGTNGKGSSVAMLNEVLRSAGRKVGLYTSPHLLCFNERVQLNGDAVDDQMLVDAFVAIAAAQKDVGLTYFEYATLAALYIFKQADLDVVVLEVGLGGRLDAVNIVDANACLITAIDLDHADWLGTDLEQIGYEKAGILRSEALAFCSDPQAPASVAQHAQSLACDLYALGRDFDYQVSDTGNWQIHWHDKRFQSLGNLPPVALSGEFQYQNGAGVVALLMMAAPDLGVSPQALESALRQALPQVRHPGRLQSISHQKQHWLFDVAHNPQSVRALAQHLQAHSAPRIAVFAALADKDLLSMIQPMVDLVQHWYLVDLAVPRAMSMTAMADILKQAGVAESRLTCCADMAQALSEVEQSQVTHRLVFGSFITVAQAMDGLVWMK